MQLSGMGNKSRGEKRVTVTILEKNLKKVTVTIFARKG
jgi:hypothetical protein